MPLGLGPVEVVVIVVLIVLVFGAKKIPLIARGLGEGIRNFKGEMREDGESRRELPGDRDSDRS